MHSQPQAIRTTSASTQRRPLLVGVVGLGPRWHDRYAPALRQLSDLYQVRGLCDQVHGRAEQEARAFHCQPAAGPSELLQDERLDALLLIDEQWYGLWPAERANRVGKPVYCALYCDLASPMAGREGRIMVGLAARTAPVTARVLHLLRSKLGVARTISCRCRLRAGAPLAAMATLSAMDWCLHLAGSQPVAVQTAVSASGDLTSVLLDLADGRAVQLNLLRHARGGLDVDILAERGAIQASLPADLRWSDARGRYRQRLTRCPDSAVRGLRRFYRAVHGGASFSPSLADVRRAWQCLEAAQLSWHERRPIDIPSPPAPR